MMAKLLKYMIRITQFIRIHSDKEFSLMSAARTLKLEFVVLIVIYVR